MGFNLGGAIAGGLQGFVMSGGNPAGAVAGGVMGGLGHGNGTAATGGIGNGVQDLGTAATLAGYESLGLQNQAFELGLASQSQQFNQMAEQKAELMREQNELRTLAVEQRKADDAVTKEYIKMIT